MPFPPPQGRGPRPGQGAAHPWQIPWAGWVEIAGRIGREIRRDHVLIVSSGLAFLAILALLPTLSALLSLYGLIADPGELQQHVSVMRPLIPPGLIDSLESNLAGVSGEPGFELALKITLSILAAAWVGMRGFLGLMRALNIVYAEVEVRSMPTAIAVAGALALGALIFWLIALTSIVAMPFLLGPITRLSPTLAPLVSALRWLLLTITTLASMMALYRFGPAHKHVHWEWVAFGALIATLFWLAGSVALSFYLRHFSHFNDLYGSLGVVIVMQLWFFLTAFLFLMGAEINVELQRQVGEEDAQ